MSHLSLSLMRRLSKTESAVFKLWMLYFQRISFQTISDRGRIKYNFVSESVKKNILMNGMMNLRKRHVNRTINRNRNPGYRTIDVNFSDVTE